MSVCVLFSVRRCARAHTALQVDRCNPKVWTQLKNDANADQVDGEQQQQQLGGQQRGRRGNGKVDGEEDWDVLYCTVRKTRQGRCSKHRKKLS